MANDYLGRTAPTNDRLHHQRCGIETIYNCGRLMLRKKLQAACNAHP